MNNYCARVENNLVVDVIVADYEWVTENLLGDWHDLGGDPITVGLGWIYDVTTNTFTAPPQVEEIDKP